MKICCWIIRTVKDRNQNTEGKTYSDIYIQEYERKAFLSEQF